MLGLVLEWCDKSQGERCSRFDDRTAIDTNGSLECQKSSLKERPEVNDDNFFPSQLPGGQHPFLGIPCLDKVGSVPPRRLPKVRSRYGGTR